MFHDKLFFFEFFSRCMDDHLAHEGRLVSQQVLRISLRHLLWPTGRDLANSWPVCTGHEFALSAPRPVWLVDITTSSTCSAAPAVVRSSFGAVGERRPASILVRASSLFPLDLVVFNISLLRNHGFLEVESTRPCPCPCLSMWRIRMTESEVECF